MCTEKMSLYFYSIIFLNTAVYLTIFFGLFFAEEGYDTVVGRIVRLVLNLSLEC